MRRAAARQPHVSLHPVAAASLLLVSALAQAQQPAQDPAQRVEVTGIRGAIESSIAIKRNADGVVEAVTSEDIGKLPDTSIADSIARLPGLAAQRIDGRPSALSIRGLGPDYAGGLLNGRQVVSAGEGRSLEYDQFPSELVSKVLVYKTADASVIGQGLSGTVDIRPVMPLDFRGRQLSISARGEKNSYGGLSPSGNGGTGNRVSIAYVDQFANNTLGVALGFAHLDTPGQAKKFESWKYGDYVGQWGAGATGVPSLGVGNNRAAFAQGFEASVTSSKQVRDGFMGVLEYRPNKDFRSTVDLYYSKFDQERVGHHWVGDIGLWSSPPAAFSNTSTASIDGTTVLASGSVANGRSLVYDKNFNRTDKITAVGWRNELGLAGNWKAMADIGYSRVDRDENYIQSVARSTTPTTLTFSGLDTVDNFGWSTNQNLTDPSTVVLTNNPDWAEMRTPKFRDETKSARLSAHKDFEGSFLAGMEVGLGYNQRDKSVESASYRLTLGSTNVAIPAAAVGAPATIGMGGISTDILTWDVPSVMGLYTAVPKDPWSAKDNRYAVHEKVATALLKFEVDSKLGSVPVRGNFGLQVVRSEQSSDGFAWNDGGNAGSGQVIPVHGGATFTDVLPSLNLAFSLQSDLIARVGLAKTMARPRMDDMRAGADQPRLVANSSAAGETQGHWTANNGGKPDLEPWRAKSLDLTLEKYIGKRSYVAVAGFYKWMDSFIYSQTTVRDFSGFPNYSSTLVPGCPASNPGCNPNLGELTTQANGRGGKVHGIELMGALDGALVTPALDGFGIVASYSVNASDLPLDNNGNRIKLDGASGTVYSLTAYYEKHGFSARIGQRYRSAFTATTRGVLLNTETSTHIDAERQVDLQIGYAFNDGALRGLSLLLQVNNLTNAPAVQRQSAEIVGSAGNKAALLPWRYESFGRAILLGATYKF
ncbi:MAG: TonB-dependent receptor [Proteobacteria bacterium]|nr:TonB-dependent receptor [Pseudomonadota bacterium]